MKFGEILEQQAYKPFDYEGFKRKAKENGADFADSLGKEVARVAAFAAKEREEQAKHVSDLGAKWRVVLNWKKSNFPDVETHISQVHHDVLEAGMRCDRLLDFITLNVTAIKKICKKHDRLTGQNLTGQILTQLQSGTLKELSDIDAVEQVVTKIKQLLSDIEPNVVVKSSSFALRGVSDFYSIPVNRITSTGTSPASSERSQGPLGNESKQRGPKPLAALLSLPLLIPDDDESVFVPTLTVTIALVGPFLAGAILGAFLNSLQALAPIDQVVTRILVFTLGSLTGSWPESKYSMTLLASAGCLGSLLLHGTGLVYVGCWLLGVGVGAWISKFPRQLATGTSLSVKCAIALAPVVGMVMGAMFTPRTIEPQLAITWFIFTLLVLMHERQAQIIIDSDAEMASEAAEEPQLSAATTAMIWASLASLALVRWARSQIVFTVVCYGGPRILSLCVASLVAAPTAALVPAWICSALSCVAVIVLQDPSAMCWFWADAATKADLALIPKEWASTTDTVIASADAFAGLSLLVVYASDVSNPTTGLAVFSAVLLASSFCGRLIADRL